MLDELSSSQHKTISDPANWRCAYATKLDGECDISISNPDGLFKISLTNF